MLPSQFRINEALGIGEHACVYRKKDDMIIEVWMSAKLAEKRARRLLTLDAKEAATYSVSDYGRQFIIRGD